MPDTEAKINFDFDLYQTAPPQVKAIKLTEDILKVLLVRIRHRSAFISWFAATEFGRMVIELSALRPDQLVLYGSRGPTPLLIGDWIVIHPDGRHYTLSHTHFTAEYTKVEKPRVVTIPIIEGEGLSR